LFVDGSTWRSRRAGWRETLRATLREEGAISPLAKRRAQSLVVKAAEVGTRRLKTLTG